MKFRDLKVGDIFTAPDTGNSSIFTKLSSRRISCDCGKCNSPNTPWTYNIYADSDVEYISHSCTIIIPACHI